jgi:hypothetical protein
MVRLDGRKGSGMTLLYLASPVATFEEDRYDRIIMDAQRLSMELLKTHTEIRAARGLYGSFEAWKRLWPNHLREIDGLIVFTALDGTIGRATAWEIEDTRQVGKPVWLLDDTMMEASLYEREKFVMAMRDGGISYTKYMDVYVPPQAGERGK